MNPPMLVIGLTGGIATGKSTVAAMFEDFGARIFNADQTAHRMLEKGQPAFEAVALAFPSVRQGDIIHRPTLGALVFRNPDELKKLEAILHPLVREQEKLFLESCRQSGIAYAVLEIPLLFETQSNQLCDITITTDCPPDIQKARALERPNMSLEKLEDILSRQMPQEQRRQKADWVIPTGMSARETKEAVASFLKAIKE